MLFRSFFFSIFCFFLIISCANQGKKDELLQQAGKIHLEAIKMDEKIRPDLTKVFSVKKRLEQKQTELTLEEKNLLEQIKQLKSSYDFWNENHVEVPGFEHEGHHHDHAHHDHDHDHGPSLEVSSEDMLSIQKEFKDSLSSIAERLDNLHIPDSLIIQ